MFRMSALAAIALAGTAAPALAQTTTPATPGTPRPATTPGTPTTPSQTPPTTQQMPGTTPGTMGAPTTTRSTPGAPATQTTPTTRTPGTTPGAQTTTGAPGTPGAQTTAAPTAGTAQGATIAATLTSTPELSTLNTAVGTAELESALAGTGPFTVFAPNNAAFGRLAPGTLDTLSKPENKATLTRLLNYHVVRGNLDGAALQAQVQSSGGRATLTTLAGQPITATLENGAIVLLDVGGGKSYVQTYDVKASNGTVHVVNGVLVPKLD